MRVGTPSGSEYMITKICRFVDVVIEDVCMPIDMPVLLIVDFDVVLGVNWLTKFRVVIDCPNRELSFDSSDRKLSCTLINPRPKSMLTMEL